LRIYVGNISYQMTEDDLRQAFEQHGQVEDVAIIRDRDTSRSKGFAFVEMPANEEAEAAIAALNGKDIEGRSVTVSEARPRPERGFGGGGGRGPRW
jgi:RNA recognition motif-containing protein